jgi:uncharacterized membrane protein (UPF0127 family)
MDGSRRRVVLVALASAGFAGCLEGDSVDDSDSSTPTESGEPTSTATPGTGSSTRTPDESTPEGDGTGGEESTSTSDGGEDTPTPTEDDGGSPVFPGYEMTTVTVQTPQGNRLGSIRAAIADTRSLRYTGLSDTESLPENYGMLFVFDELDSWRFVMRGMDFGIDIVYADDDGEITTIHNAPAPGPDEDGEKQKYPGRGQYVLEVNRGWTTDRGVEEGDLIDFEL